MPRRYLTRVMQDLASAGLVGSRSGPGGGYILMCRKRNSNAAGPVGCLRRRRAERLFNLSANAAHLRRLLLDPALARKEAS